MKQYDISLAISTLRVDDYHHEKNHAPLLYRFYTTPFGTCLLATIEKKIAYLGFLHNDDKDSTLKELADYWQHHELMEETDNHQDLIDIIFNPHNRHKDRQLALLIKGTPFQLKVWQELTKLSFATTASYEALAHAPAIRSSARAVGTALAHNKIAVVIPCHRIIRKSGQPHQYYWGKNLKKHLLAWESSYAQNEK
jgi:AraC family transcriptional regulator of adaptative response/methylated-DNA-[protein]-cysteine methyltransferase